MKINQESTPSKGMGYRMLHQSQLQSQAMTLNKCQNGYFYSHTF